MVRNNHLSGLKVQAQRDAERSNVFPSEGAPGAGPGDRSKFFAQSGSKIEQEYKNQSLLNGPSSKKTNLDLWKL